MFISLPHQNEQPLCCAVLTFLSGNVKMSTQGKSVEILAFHLPDSRNNYSIICSNIIYVVQIVVVIYLSQETMELCFMIQFFVELHDLLWLYRSIIDWQALVQLSQMKFLPGSERKDSALCWVCSLSSFPIADFSACHSSECMPSLSFFSHCGLKDLLCFSVLSSCILYFLVSISLGSNSFPALGCMGIHLTYEGLEVTSGGTFYKYTCTTKIHCHQRQFHFALCSVPYFALSSKVVSFCTLLCCSMFITVSLKAVSLCALLCCSTFCTVSMKNADHLANPCLCRLFLQMLSIDATINGMYIGCW